MIKGTYGIFFRLQRFKMNIANSVVNQENNSLRTMNTDQLLDLFDLDEKGSLYEAGIEYEINENTNLLIAVNKIFDNKTIQMNPFTGMEDFSHIRFELKYYY